MLYKRKLLVEIEVDTGDAELHELILEKAAEIKSTPEYVVYQFLTLLTDGVKASIEAQFTDGMRVVSVEDVTLKESLRSVRG